MAEESRQIGRQRLFSVIKILYKYSDEYHPLNTNKILDILYQSYGIKAERKSVYKDIESLKQCGMDIEHTSSTKEGYYLASRSFEVAEIRLLIDAVLSARFITPKKTKELTKKLYDELSCYQSESIEMQAFYDNRTKLDNEQIYYIVDKINSAIAAGKKISFIYHHKMIKYNKVINDIGRKFVISPYALLWAQDKYYVAGNYEKYNDTSKYRLDKMSNVEIIDEDIRSFTEVTSYKKRFDTADYINKSFMMYDGTENTIELICDMSLIETMLDRFDKKAHFINYGENKFKVCARAFVSEGLVDWLIPYCDRCYIAAPIDLRKSVTEKAKRITAYLSNTLNSKE